jgi:hypothetical protein
LLLLCSGCTTLLGATNQKFDNATSPHQTLIARNLGRLQGIVQARPQGVDFGLAPSEEWRAMSASKREIVPNIRRWGLLVHSSGVRRPPFLERFNILGH